MRERLFLSFFVVQNTFVAAADPAVIDLAADANWQMPTTSTALAADVEIIKAHLGLVR